MYLESTQRDPGGKQGQQQETERETEMNTFTKNKQTGNWDIIGPEVARSREGDTLTVTKSSGETTTVNIGRPSKIFLAKFGRHAGQRVAIARVKKSSPKKRRIWVGMDCPCCDSEPLDHNLSCWECGFHG